LSRSVADLFNDCFLGNRLAVPGAHQCTSCAFTGDINGFIMRKEMIPVCLINQVEELVESFAGIRTKDNKEPVAEVHPEVQTEQLFGGSSKENPAVFRSNVIRPELPQFSGDQSFHAESRSGKAIIITVHNRILPFQFTWFYDSCKAWLKP